MIFLTNIVDDSKETDKVIINIKTRERGLKVKITEDPKIEEIVNILKIVNPTSSIEDNEKEIKEVTIV